MDEKNTQAQVPAGPQVLSDDELAACTGGAGEVADPGQAIPNGTAAAPPTGAASSGSPIAPIG